MIHTMRPSRILKGEDARNTITRQLVDKGPTARKSMRISRVSLRNYRAYESLDLDLNSGMNVIVGENNVGKSSLMQAVQFVISLPSGNQLSRDHWPDGRPKGPLSISLELVLTQGEVEKLSASLPHPQRTSVRDRLVLSTICQGPGQT